MSNRGQGRTEGWPGPDQPLDPASVAQLTAVAMRLAMEVGVLRDRLRSHELLLEQHGLLSSTAVDAFTVPADEQRLRDAASLELITSLAGDIGPR